MTTHPLEPVARAICRNSSHAPNGTCAAICMDGLGDVPAGGCPHAMRVHGKRVHAATKAVLDLMEKWAEGKDAELKYISAANIMKRARKEILGDD